MESESVGCFMKMRTKASSDGAIAERYMNEKPRLGNFCEPCNSSLDSRNAGLEICTFTHLGEGDRWQGFVGPILSLE